MPSIEDVIGFELSQKIAELEGQECLVVRQSENDGNHRFLFWTLSNSQDTGSGWYNEHTRRLSEVVLPRPYA